MMERETAYTGLTDEQITILREASHAIYVAATDEPEVTPPTFT